jgi:hypothetical protein
VRRLLVLLVLLAGCSSQESPSPPVEDTPPPSWIGMQPGDARAFTGDAGELTLIYVDETYSIDGENTSALTFEHDDAYVTDYFIESGDGLSWYGRRGSWRAGRDGEEPRAVPLDDDTATFGDITIALSDDGPVAVETPDGVFEAVT